MSRALDVNVLLYASNETSPEHGAAVAALQALATGPGLVYLFWPTVMAYLRLATHPAIAVRPLTIEEAMANIEALLARPNVRTAGEGEAFWERFGEVVADARPTGNLMPDAHLAALMLEHGVGTVVTRDRDFRRFRHLAVEDPFAADS
jgi:toxin-antitoxin system PIN domain toxin